MWFSDHHRSSACHDVYALVHDVLDVSWDAQILVLEHPELHKFLLRVLKIDHSLIVFAPVVIPGLVDGRKLNLVIPPPHIGEVLNLLGRHLVLGVHLLVLRVRLGSFLGGEHQELIRAPGVRTT